MRLAIFLESNRINLSGVDNLLSHTVYIFVFRIFKHCQILFSFLNKFFITVVRVYCVISTHQQLFV